MTTESSKSSGDVKQITARATDYSQWYSDVITVADLAEHAPVRGCMIIKPYGYAIWEKIQAQVDKMIKAKGVDNAYFPFFIPDDFLKREAEHVEGFSPELAVVTHAGGKKLEEPLVVRPTSETIIYDSFAKWISSYRDLPFTINQWANIVRWEKRPRLFLRTSEFLWQEGHTAHATAQEAEDYALMILHDVYRDFVEQYLAMPVYCGQKSQSERFAGALNTYCIEALMQDGKSLQAGTAHDLSDNFAKSFGVTFQDQDGQTRHVHQTSWGLSTRLIGGLIMTHSDDKGLVLPPRIAPIQVVIVPICRDENDPVLGKAKELQEMLGPEFSVKVDTRTAMRPGEKFYEWEKKGVPLRIEIGPKDLANDSCVVVRRDDASKESVPLSALKEKIRVVLDEMQKLLFDKAIERREQSKKIADTWEDFQAGIESGGYIWTHFCGQPDCEARIKEETKSVSRCLPFDSAKEEGDCACIRCGGKTSGRRWIFARAY